MNKIKILGIGNINEHNYLNVRKNKDFFEWLRELLSGSFKVYDVGTYYTTKKYIQKDKNIKNFVDKHENYYGSDKDNNVRIDIFYGKRDVFFILNMTSAQRKKFIKKLEEISIWVKPKKPKKDNVRKTVRN